jgi:hypothetical protein
MSIPQFPEVFLLLFLQKKKAFILRKKKDVNAGLRRHDVWVGGLSG